MAENSAFVSNEFFKKYTFPILLWMVLIFVSSSIPQEAFPDVGFWGWAKLVHLFYYCVLCFLIYRAIRHQNRFPGLSRYAFVIGILLATLYGATDEFHQTFTAGRHGRLTDVLIDGLGACLFFVGVKVFALIGQGRTTGSP